MVQLSVCMHHICSLNGSFVIMTMTFCCCCCCIYEWRLCPHRFSTFIIVLKYCMCLRKIVLSLHKKRFLNLDLISCCILVNASSLTVGAQMNVLIIFRGAAASEQHRKVLPSGVTELLIHFNKQHGKYVLFVDRL